MKSKTHLPYRAEGYPTPRSKPGFLPRQTVADFPVGTRVLLCSWGGRVALWRVGQNGTVVKQNRTTVVVRCDGYQQARDHVFARPSQIRKLPAV